MAERAWPKDVEPRTKEAWMAAAVSEDPNEMQLIGKVLKALKYSARDYVTWSKDQRVETIVKHQTEAGLGGNGASKGAAAPKGGKRLGGKKRTKGAAKPAAAPATLPADGSGSGISAAQFEKLLAATEANAEALEELATKVDAIDTLVTETHFGFMCIALGDETIRGNFEDPGIQEEMLGEPALLGGEEEGEEGEE
jgi:hypothetical protein